MKAISSKCSFCWLVCVWCALAALAGGRVRAQFESSFQRLGDLPGGDFRSEAFDVSADGSVVVGIGVSVSGFEAFRWTEADGMVGLGDLPGGEFWSFARGVSADGTTVVGSSKSALDTSEAFRWTEADGMVGLGDLPGGDVVSTAWATSADGTVIVGGAGAPSGTEAFRWTVADGMVGLGDLPGGGFGSFATDVTPDGTVVVGYSLSALGYEAFRWTSDDGIVGLGKLPSGWIESFAQAVSADGRTVVGHGTTAHLSQAFRWTNDDGMVILGGSSRVAFAVSADGSIVGGYGTAGGTFAMIWNPVGGVRELGVVLRDEFGLNLDGLWPRFVRGISSDGRVLVGKGSRSHKDEAFRAILPAPCGGDAACDNGEFCDGLEVCVEGRCRYGTLPDCEDDVECTVDSCDVLAQACNNTAVNGRCGDGVFCNGAEICDVTLGCQPGTPPGCDDGVGCTVDSCDDSTDLCSNTPVDASCDDGVFCNGAEVCDAASDCQRGPLPSCDDGVICTVDACDVSTDMCSYTPIDSGCDDGEFCNGMEVCDANSGCSPGTEPCPGQVCDEENNACTMAPIPTVSTWGLLSLALLLLTAAKRYFGRRPNGAEAAHP